MRIEFGAGNLFLNPTGGNTPTDFTPQQLVTLQDVTIDINATIKDLRGQLQFPDDTAISDRKITFKSGSGRFNLEAWNNTIFGEAATSTGGAPASVSEAHSVPASSPYQIAVTNDTQFVTDLGVVYSSNGQQLKRLPSGTPSVGQYTVSAGIYQFAAADASAAMLINYTYTVLTGTLLTVSSHIQGYGPTLELFLENSYVPGASQGGVTTVPNYVHFYACKISKLGMPWKRADYFIADLEGECYANAAGKVADFYED